MTKPWPMLTTPRTLLRPLADGDREFVLGHFGDPDVRRHLVDSGPPASRGLPLRLGFLAEGAIRARSPAAGLSEWHVGVR